MDLEDLYQCPYCGYIGETSEFLENSEDEPLCPGCGEDLTGDFVLPEEEVEEPIVEEEDEAF